MEKNKLVFEVNRVGGFIDFKPLATSVSEECIKEINSLMRNGGMIEFYGDELLIYDGNTYDIDIVEHDIKSDTVIIELDNQGDGTYFGSVTLGELQVSDLIHLYNIIHEHVSNQK